MEESRGQTPGALQATHGEELGLSSGPALPGGAFWGWQHSAPLLPVRAASNWRWLLCP